MKCRDQERNNKLCKCSVTVVYHGIVVSSKITKSVKSKSKQIQSYKILNMRRS